MRKLAPLLALLFSASSWAVSEVDILSDLNGRYGTVGYHERVSAAVAAIVARRPQLVIAAGDLIAAQRRPPLSAEHLARMWQAFDDTVFGPLEKAGIPLVVSAGNHDASAFAGFEGDRTAFAHYWQSKPPPMALLPGSNYPWYFAGKVGSRLVVSLYVTVQGELPGEQKQFLSTLLDTLDSGVSEVYLVGHLPLHDLAKGREGDSLDDPALEKLLAKLTVPVWYVSGHHHVFYLGRDGDGELLHLAAPPLGGNRRTWLATDSHSPFGFIAVDNARCVSLHSPPAFGPVAPRGIPSRIGSQTLASDRVATSSGGHCQ
ncbi:metallophosphoesterase family protein [Parahaliea maris]|nr:metallophosphoesterase [Parahaliea maris]